MAEHLSRLQMDVRKREGIAFVTLAGTMTEGAGVDLAEIAGKLTETTVVDMSDIERITSPGIRDWCRFVAAAEAKGVRFVLVRCALVVIEQIILVRDFLGKGVVKTFFAPYACSRCGMEQRLLIESRDLKEPKAPPCNCPRCHEPMLFDSIEESYFGFLKTANPVVLDPRLDALVDREQPINAPVVVLGDGPTQPNEMPVDGGISDSVPSNPSVHEVIPFAAWPEDTALTAPPRPASTSWAVWLLIGIAVACAITWLL